MDVALGAGGVNSSKRDIQDHTVVRLPNQRLLSLNLPVNNHVYISEISHRCLQVVYGLPCAVSVVLPKGMTEVCAKYLGCSQ